MAEDVPKNEGGEMKTWMWGLVSVSASACLIARAIYLVVATWVTLW